MILKIDPKTEKGQIQLEAIGWAQDQMNQVLERYFNKKAKMLKGIRVEFRMGLDLDLSDKIKIDVYELVAQTQEEFDKDIDDVKKNTAFKVEDTKK